MASYIRPMIPLLSTATDVSTKKTFTVMTYNVLAQHLVSREWYNYTSATALKWAKRRENLKIEISQINPDVVCFQECSYYDNFWEGAMKLLGYTGAYKIRPNGRKDGCAIFYKQEKFEQVGMETLEYDELAKPDGSDRAEMVKENVAVFLALKFRDENKGIIVGTTHIFWNYRYSYIRLRQSMAYLAKAVDISKRLNMPFILTGDYNFTPDSTIYSILTEGKINEGSKIDNFSFFEEDETSHLKNDVAPPVLTPEKLKIQEERMAHVRDLVATERPKYPLLRSVYAPYQTFIPVDPRITPAPLHDVEPPFTNFTATWNGTLDYIFMSKDEQEMIPLKIMDLPPLDELLSQTALPNDTYSSDHVCIMCEFCI